MDGHVSLSWGPSDLKDSDKALPSVYLTTLRHLPNAMGEAQKDSQSYDGAVLDNIHIPRRPSSCIRYIFESVFYCLKVSVLKIQFAIDFSCSGVQH